MEIQTTKFLELWQDFTSSFKGNLINEAKKQKISYAIAKMALTEAVLTWTSEYTINGRWLYKLMHEEPAKGELIKEIITQDIVLSEVKSDNNTRESLKYIAPLGVGAIGYGVAHIVNMSTIGTACAALIPMVIAYPLTSKYITDRKVKDEDMIILSYVNQLNKYKESIMSVLLTQ